ncbi:hypothetical protein [Brevifollis gellanilyticus]|nr:hypothetical protein [Brevifollis gellanilyticus]
MKKTKPNIDDLSFEVHDAMVNLEFGKLLPLNEQLFEEGSVEAGLLLNELWETFIRTGEMRRTIGVERLVGRPHGLRSSAYMGLQTPYGTDPGYDLDPQCWPSHMLMLPPGDPEYKFEWAQALKSGPLTPREGPPRIVIQIGDKQEVKVFTSEPAEFKVIRRPIVPTKKAARDALVQRIRKFTKDEICELLRDAGRLGRAFNP